MKRNERKARHARSLSLSMGLTLGGRGSTPFNRLVAEARSTGVVADFSESSFAWGGATRALSDLTANGDGSYDLNNGAWFAGECTVLFDYINTGDFPADTQNYLSWTSAALDRIEWETTTSSSSDGTYKVPRLYANPSGFNHNSIRIYPGRSSAERPTGNQRVISTIKSSTAPLLQQSNWTPSTGTTAVGALATPTKLRFGGRARFNDQRLTNATLQRVYIWPRVLTSSEIAVLGAGAKTPVHLIGDSFLNADRIRGHLQAALASRGYVPVTQDGVGGTSLAQQAVSLALDSVTTGSPSVTYDISKWKNSTLVIVDGGLDDTSAAAIVAIQDMINLLPHRRWLYVESAPNENTGTAGRIAWDARIAAIRAFVGEDRYIPTLVPAQAAGDNSANDNAEIALGLWPLSLKTSTVDFHPNEAGSSFLANLINTRLVSSGWV